MKNKIYITFYKTRSAVGWIIRTLSFGRYDHVAVRINEYIYEAHPTDGVKRTHVDKYTRKAAAEFSLSNYDDSAFANMKTFITKQLGKRYDYIGVISFVFRFLKPRIGSWYCSELTGVVINKFFNTNNIAVVPRVSPQQLFNQIKQLCHDSKEYRKIQPNKM